MIHAIAVLSSCLAMGAPVESSAASGQLQLKGCPVALLKDILLSSDEAGQIVEMAVKPESNLAQGDLIAQIDQRQVDIQREAAFAAFQGALAESKNNVNERFARASFDQAKAELQMSKDADRSYPGAVVLGEIKKLELAAKRAELQIEQAVVEHDVAVQTTAQKKAEVDAAELSQKRRRIAAPFAGVIAELKKKEHEWVREGDPVVRLIQMDRVKVQGQYKVADLLAEEIRGRKVIVTAVLGKKTFQFDGTVTEIGTRISSGNCTFYAEVENRLENNEWLLREGMLVEMTVDLTSR